MKIDRWILPAALFALVLPLYLGLLPWAFDDAYIHFRMAGNLASGHGPYINPGQTVNAGSAPAWTVGLALLARLGASAPVWVGVVNAIATALGAALFVELARKLGGRSLGLGYRVLFATAYCGVVHYSGAGLMETPAALLCLGLGLWAWLDDRPVAAGFLAVACFLRLELVPLAGLIVVDGVLFRRWSRTRTSLWAIGCGAPFLVYQLYCFGSAVPHAALAKAEVYDLTFSQAFGLLSAFAAPSTLPFGSGVVRIVCAAAVVLAVAITVNEKREGGEGSTWTRPAILAIGTLAIPLAYVVTRTLVFPWYPPLFVAPGLLVAFSVARRSSQSWPALAVALCGLFPYALDLAPSVRAAISEPQGYRYFAVNARVRSYLELGRQLGEAYPGARLLSSEVGGLGYAYPGEIVDGMGLVSPRALEFHPMRVPEQRRSGVFGAIPAALVERERPELIVSMDAFIEEFVRSPVAKSYRRYRVPVYVAEDILPGTVPVLWGSSSMNVFIRDDLPSNWTPSHGEGNGRSRSNVVSPGRTASR